MNEKDFEDMLGSALREDAAEYGSDVTGFETFEAVGMLSMNKGLVVRMNDGSEFQLTIVQSRQPR